MKYPIFNYFISLDIYFCSFSSCVFFVVLVGGSGIWMKNISYAVGTVIQHCLYYSSHLSVELIGAISNQILNELHPNRMNYVKGPDCFTVS